MTVRTLVAHKGGAEVKVVLNETPGTAQLVISTKGDVGGIETAPSPTAAAAARPTARAGAPRLEVPERARGTLQCQDAEVVVNGNDGDPCSRGNTVSPFGYGNYSANPTANAANAAAVEALCRQMMGSAGAAQYYRDGRVFPTGQGGGAVFISKRISGGQLDGLGCIGDRALPVTQHHTFPSPVAIGLRQLGIKRQRLGKRAHCFFVIS